MSIHWTIIAGFLYAEIGTLFLLLVPFVSTRMWNKVFKSRFLKGLENQLIYYFYVLVAILILFFLDSIREMRKYSEDPNDAHSHGTSGNHLDVQMQAHMRLFRAQRNFYIAGFALFLCLVIKRMVTLIMANACLEAEKTAAMKQAESASRAAETLMASGGGSDGDNTEVNDLKEKLAAAQKETDAAKKNVEAMKTQSESLAAEYDRLMAEKDKLEKKVNIMGEGDKKDE